MDGRPNRRKKAAFQVEIVGKQTEKRERIRKIVSFLSFHFDSCLSTLEEGKASLV